MVLAPPVVATCHLSHTPLCSTLSGSATTQVLDDQVEKFGGSWQSVTTDTEESPQVLEPALVKYQVRV